MLQVPNSLEILSIKMHDAIGELWVSGESANKFSSQWTFFELSITLCILIDGDIDRTGLGESQSWLALYKKSSRARYRDPFQAMSLLKRLAWHTHVLLL